MGWGQEQQAKHQRASCGTEPSAIGTEHTASLRSPVDARQSGAEASPPAAAGRLPALGRLSRGGAATACVVAGAPRRMSPVAPLGATRKAPAARARRSFLDAFREVQAARRN